MPRKSSSQWEFGELFAKPRTPPTPSAPTAPAAAPAPAPRRIYSVADLTAEIKGLLEQRLGEVSVSGEITNLRSQSSGHIYFTLKDPSAQLSCVLFRGTPSAARPSLRDGVKVVLTGNLSVYEPRGQYQLIVRTAELQGIGALQAAFERLKQKLNAEGLFSPDRKRPIPTFPRRIGLVTSPTGAALRDVLHVIERRFAGLDLLLAPCRVQGQGAEHEIASAIRRLNTWSHSQPDHPLDLILVTRGGGSLEDLWAFNEEAVARAIFESNLPVVSAVGHEIDFTIADFVADLRAATPSAAAEILTAAYVASRDHIADTFARLLREAEAAVDDSRLALDTLAARLGRAHPRRRLEERGQRIDDLALSLSRLAGQAAAQARRSLDTTRARLLALRPGRRLAETRRRLERPAADLAASAHRALGTHRDRLERLSLRLHLLAPDRILARGYSITTDAASGRVVRDAGAVPVGTALLTRLASGQLRSVSVPLSPESSGPTPGTNQSPS
jgi:exodeoxyribonuclease VII large subunit